MLDKKGFLFTVTIFLILTYILLSISVWVKSLETSERSFSEFYKESTIELTISQITPEKVDQATNMMMTRAVSRINDAAISSPVLPGPAGDENKNIRDALGELLMAGAANPMHFDGVSSATTPENVSSLVSWVDSLNSSLKSIGVYVDGFQVNNFVASQTSFDKIDYSFDMTLSLKDYAGTSSVSRTYSVKNSVDITGFTDPALVRASKLNPKLGTGKTIYRQFFFNKENYSDLATVKAKTVSSLSNSISGGQGWFYGYLATPGPSLDLIPTATSVPDGKQQFYILVGNYTDMKKLKDDNPDLFAKFGAYLITTVPSKAKSPLCDGQFDESDTFNPIKYLKPICAGDLDASVGTGIITSKPFIISSGFDPVVSAPSCPILDAPGQNARCALIQNTYSAADVAKTPSNKNVVKNSGIYGVESMRDLVMCGYYIPDPNAPSYFQRLFANPYSMKSPFGIETFVIGAYANDVNVYGSGNSVNGRLDSELFNISIDGVKIKGMPGCKDLGTCSDTPITGIFAVSKDTADAYGLNQIACNSGAGCNQ